MPKTPRRRIMTTGDSEREHKRQANKERTGQLPWGVDPELDTLRNEQGKIDALLTDLQSDSDDRDSRPSSLRGRIL